MSTSFTPAQEDRIAEIVRGIVKDVLQGTDARIREAIDTGKTLADEARIRDIIREEFDDDYALDNSRNHEEFLVESQRMRSHRSAKERKRNGDRPHA